MNVGLELFSAEHVDLRTEEQLQATNNCSPTSQAVSQLEWGAKDTKDVPEVVPTHHIQSNAQLESSHLEITSCAPVEEQGLSKYSLDTKDPSSVALSTIRTMSDDHFLWIADHVRLQRSVARYAAVTLAEHQQDSGQHLDERTMGCADSCALSFGAIHAG